MNILITFHSSTGNTEKIAKAIKEELSDQEVDLIPTKDVDSSSLSSYDIVFLGSGTYGGNIGKSLKNLMRKITEYPKNFAIFSTHASSDPGMYANNFKRIKKQLMKNNCSMLGEFDCLGESKGVTREQQDRLRENIPLERLEINPIESPIGHPNSEDIVNAKKFAKRIIQKF